MRIPKPRENTRQKAFELKKQRELETERAEKEKLGKSVGCIIIIAIFGHKLIVCGYLKKILHR